MNGAIVPDHIKEAINHYIPSMEGWLLPERGCEMAELILNTRPDVVVEIGVFGGRSLLAQAFALRENNKGKIYGIDPWQTTNAVEGVLEKENRDWWTSSINMHHIHEGCVRAIWDHHLEPWVVVIRAPSQYCYELFPNIDILYIDGNHSELASCRDVTNYATRVKSGGWIWMDDCDWPTTEHARALLGTMATLERDCGAYRLYQKL
jgi:methyltransferase family protein